LQLPFQHNYMDILMNLLLIFEDQMADASLIIQSNEFKYFTYHHRISIDYIALMKYTIMMVV